MPSLPLRWFLVLVGLFLVSLGADLYLSRPDASPAGVAAAERLNPADFLSAAAAGELSAGTITYRMNAAALADLTATRTLHNGVAADVKATARLTDADLSVLRKNHFTEDDAATVSKVQAATWRGRSAVIAHTSMQILAVITVVAAILLCVARYAARYTSLSVRQMRAATSRVKFSAVAGCDEAKNEVHEVVEFLKNPARFRTTGGRMPKGVLLVGPPGTGKTMLAKAVAGEAKAHFYSLSGSDFVELYVGVGASRVRSLFKKARETAPSIIFIDEIDALGRTRSSGEGGSQQEHDQTLNALLVAMDGFDSDDAVVVFGATNRPDTMDRALLRPGRFDRQISLSLPDLAGRVAILQVHAGTVKLDTSVDLQHLAKGTPGFSGADLANLLNEGAIHAARNHHATITMADLEEARDKINWGRETPRALTASDKRIIAYHEAGHALVQVLSGDDTARLHKVTIIPRGRSLGSTQFTPERDLYNHSFEQLVSRLRCLMAGRVAEELALGGITSGAACDIQEATRIARQMVFEWGMSPLGFMALSRAEGETEFASPQTLHEAEHHVKTLLAENYTLATEIVSGARAALDAIAHDLIEHETITGEHVRQLIAANSPLIVNAQAAAFTE